MKIFQVRQENCKSNGIIHPERGENGCSFAGVREVVGPRMPENQFANEKSHFSVRFYSGMHGIAVAFLFRERSRIFRSIFLIIDTIGLVYG